MPSITVPALNDLYAFHSILQSGNVSEVKGVLIETVIQMRASRMNWGYFSSSSRAMKFEAESDLLATLNVSRTMDEIKQALSHYRQQLNDVLHQIHSEGNTSAFIRGICPLTSQVSSTPESIRIKIMKAMKKAGYHPNRRGMCYGIAWTALLACVRQDGQAYMERMQYLKQMNTRPLPGVNDIHQLYPFFDAVTLSQTNYIDMIGYRKGIGYPGRSEVNFPGRIIGGNKPYYNVPVVKYTFVAEFTPKTFIQFLRQTQENNKGTPFGVMINYVGHAISIGFDGKKWLAVNHNGYYYTEAMVLLYAFFGRLHVSYKNNGKMIAGISVVANNEHSLNINNDALVVNAKKTVSVPLALHSALYNGDANVTTDCLTVIGQQTLTPEKLFELLACKNKHGWSGLHMALFNGRSDAITTFIRASAELITTLPLIEKRKSELLYRLLACKDFCDTSGLHIALLHGHSEAITAFIQESTAAVFALHLPDGQKVKFLYTLLASKDSRRIPGFYMTLQYGHAEAITAFIQASATTIASFSMPKKQKANLLYELLLGRRNDGILGFHMTLQNGNTDAITAFMQASVSAVATLFNSGEEMTESLYRLFYSMERDNYSDFSLVMRRGGPAVNKTFNEGIDQLPLSAEQKQTLKYQTYRLARRII